MQIYSIGHSNRDIEEFINLLKKFGIEVVVDVRRFPVSKFSCYNKENLKEVLEKNGIKYVHFENLGGYRGGYEKWMLTHQWRDAYNELKEMALNKKVAIMCAEKYPFRCHRRYIARQLIKEKWEVLHIINDRTWKEKL